MAEKEGGGSHGKNLSNKKRPNQQQGTTTTTNNNKNEQQQYKKQKNNSTSGKTTNSKYNDKKSNTNNNKFVKKTPNSSSKENYNNNKSSSFQKSSNNINKKYDSNKQNDNKKHDNTNPPIKVRKNHDIVLEGKRIWNILRLKNNSDEQVDSYMKELMPIIQTHLYDISLQHDAARIVQAAIQFGSIEDKRSIVSELCNNNTNASNTTNNIVNVTMNTNTTTNTTNTSSTNTKATTTKTNTSSSNSNHNNNHFIELCKNQYGHYVIKKILKYCCIDLQCIQMIGNCMKGHIPKLALHTIGANVIDTLFNSTLYNTSINIPKNIKNIIYSLKNELYGPFCIVYQSTSMTTTLPTLQSNLETIPDKKDKILDYVRNNILSKGIDKGLYFYTYFQRLLCEYMDVVSSNEIRNIINTTTSVSNTNNNLYDNILHLLSNPVGIKIVCYMISYSTIKDRKRICKILKGYTKSTLLHHDAYVVIIRLIQCIDDTVLLQKYILNELIQPVVLVQPVAVPDKKKKKDDKKNKEEEKDQAMVDVGEEEEEEEEEHDDEQGDDDDDDDNDEMMEDNNVKENDSDDHIIKKRTESVLAVSVPPPTASFISPLYDIAMTDHGSKFLRMILIPHNDTKITNDDELLYMNKILNNKHENQSLLFNIHPTINEKNNDNGELVAVRTSKKDLYIRRKEIYNYMKDTIIQLCNNHIKTLLHSISGGTMILRDLYQYHYNDLLSVSTTAEAGSSSTTFIQSLVNVCYNDLLEYHNSNAMQKDDINNNDKKNVLSVFEDRISYLTLKFIIMNDDTNMKNKVDNYNMKENFTYQFVTFLCNKQQEEDADHNNLFQMMATTNRGCHLLSMIIQNIKLVDSSLYKTICTKYLLVSQIQKQYISLPSSSKSPKNIKNNDTRSSKKKKDMKDDDHNKNEETKVTATSGYEALVNELKKCK